MDFRNIWPDACVSFWWKEELKGGEDMKIAHIAPPWLAIPPKNYGGTETVISHLVEEQVAQGHDVTLLAPGDARTAARLVSFFDTSLIDSGVPWHAHLKEIGRASCRERV